MFKYEWIWIKAKATNFLMGKRQPLKYTENILVFFKKQPIYNPQMIKRDIKNKRNNKKCTQLVDETKGLNSNKYADRLKAGMNDYIYPKNYLQIPQNTKIKSLHPTQKPVALGQYLIRTYTNEGDLMLDNTCGSGSFLVAAKQLHRNFIGIEISPEYCKIANQRLAQKILF